MVYNKVVFFFPFFNFAVYYWIICCQSWVRVVLGMWFVSAVCSADDIALLIGSMSICFKNNDEYLLFICFISYGLNFNPSKSQPFYMNDSQLKLHQAGNWPGAYSLTYDLDDTSDMRARKDLNHKANLIFVYLQRLWSIHQNVLDKVTPYVTVWLFPLVPVNTRHQNYSSCSQLHLESA